MDQRRLKSILLALAALAFAASPLLVPGFGGFDPNRFPVPQENPPVQPAGYAFVIWGLIYAWLLAHAGFGLLKRGYDADWDAPRWPLIVSLAVGATWLPVAKQSPLAAMVLIFVMLAGALMALFAAPRLDRPWARVPISIYAGWLTAASFVSVAINAAGYGLGSATVWAWFAVLALFAVAGWVQWRIGRVFGYGLTVAWALFAVAVQNGWGNLPLTFVALLGTAGFAALPFFAPRQTWSQN